MTTRMFRNVSAALAAVALAQASAVAQGIKLIEIYASHSGTDFYEYIELKGIPGRVLDDIFVVAVRGDADANPGFADCSFSLDSMALANARVKRLLDEYEAPALDAGIAEALQEYVDRRKASEPDAFG